MSEPEVLHTYGIKGRGRRLVRGPFGAKHQAVDLRSGQWKDVLEGHHETDMAEIQRLAATVKALREERESIRVALANWLAGSDRLQRSAYGEDVIGAIVDRLASPSVPAVSS